MHGTAPAQSLEQDAPAVHRVTWREAGDIADRVTEATFPAYVDGLARTHAQRVRDGDFDHLIHYLLQSRRFTTLPPIEPALSARAFVDALPARARATFLDSGQAGRAAMPPAVEARTRDLLKAIETPGADVRLRYFGDLVRDISPDARGRTADIAREYLRVMRFVYNKEFVARHSPQPAEAVGALYRTRGLSTDTAVEAGYLVSTGLGILHSLNPGRRLRRVLIIGPGLDLAPRTALLEVGDPESYQPWAVIDAALAQGLATLPDLEVVVADINPRVVSHLRRAKARPPALTLITELQDGGPTTLSTEFRDYFSRLGNAIAARPPGRPTLLEGHLERIVSVGEAAAMTLRPVRLDIVVDRLDRGDFDLVVATNVLTYFEDDELELALSGIRDMLAPGGVFLHNEARPSLEQLTARLGLPLEQSRLAVIATVKGTLAPLVDGVWLHRKQAPPGER
jgi:SAM-dependent methyltransferase